LDGDVVERLYQSVGIVVFPSFCGPDNLPPLEAISHSVTAAISDLPGLKEQWGEAFYYFDPDSPSSIANSIRVGLRFGITEQMAETRGILEQNLSPSRSIEIVIGRIDRIAPRIANISP
jgi:glycosyltransferase involved in cell wall biosynthesis